MYFSKAFISSVLLGCAAATNHEAGASHTVAPVGTKGVAAAAPSAPVAGMVNTHVVRVGGPNGTLRFFPDTLAAEIGDLVQFQFYPKVRSIIYIYTGPC
jgi:plastocyanin